MWDSVKANFWAVVFSFSQQLMCLFTVVLAFLPYCIGFPCTVQSLESRVFKWVIQCDLHLMRITLYLTIKNHILKKHFGMTRLAAARSVILNDWKPGKDMIRKSAMGGWLVAKALAVSCRSSLSSQLLRAKPCRFLFILVVWSNRPALNLNALKLT